MALTINQQFNRFVEFASARNDADNQNTIARLDSIGQDGIKAGRCPPRSTSPTGNSRRRKRIMPSASSTIATARRASVSVSITATSALARSTSI